MLQRKENYTHGKHSCSLPVQVRREQEEVRKRRLDEFMAGFNCISLRLKEMYQMITLGGDAELELVDSLDPFSEVCLNLRSQIFMRRLLLESPLLRLNCSFTSFALYLAMCHSPYPLPAVCYIPFNETDAISQTIDDTHVLPLWERRRGLFARFTVVGKSSRHEKCLICFVLA